MTNILSFFAILSAVSTAIYTFITIKTLCEIKKQRETTYLPHVILGQSSYTMSRVSEESNELIFEEHKTKLKQKKCSLNIYNIGLASAQNLKFQFKIDTNYYINLLKENVENFSTTGKLDGFLFIDSNSFKSGHNLPVQLFKEKDFLLPVNIEKSSYKLDLPPYFIEFLSILAFEIEDNHNLISDLPKFHLEIKYDDLYNKQHIKTYPLCINIFSMTKTDIIFEVINT